MISNYDDDAVEQDLVGTCRDTSSYCGIRDRLYPDRRNMGFPFDRLSSKKDGNLKEFLLPNMKAIDCKIFFEDKIVERPQSMARTMKSRGTISSSSTTTSADNITSTSKNTKS